MKHLTQRFISFFLVCITLLSFSSGIAYASEDIPTPEEVNLSADILPETEESPLQEDTRSEEVIEISIEPPADNHDSEEAFFTEANPAEEESAEEIESTDDPFASQPLDIGDDSPIRESTVENNAPLNSTTETQFNEADDIALLSTNNTSAHGCGYEQIDFRGMCRSNYQLIKTVYTDSSSAGYGAGYSAAILLWVDSVREYGVWDYKRTEKYGPGDTIFCSYYDGAYHDITSEWMGNYNYGYTGSYLFSLETLLDESFVISKFALSDVYTDWSAIIAGYNTAQAEQNNIRPVSRWIKFLGEYFYFDSNGTMAVGWKKIDGNWYYFNSMGIMLTGWIQVSGTWYYLNSSGVMQTGWVKYNDKWYYLNSSGAMLTGWQQIGSPYYYFESSGDWSGWIIYGGYHYYRDPSTGEIYTKGWLKYNGYWYYLNTTTGKIFTGWLLYNGGYYYLSPSTGKMITGWLKYNSYWYYLSSSGKMYASQWLKYNGYWYYFQSNGKMAVSTTLTIDGTQYTFDSSGHMVT